MNRKTMFIFPVLVSLVLLSCAGENKRDIARPTERKSFSERMSENNGYQQDQAGNWVPRNDKRSSFENVGPSPYFKGNAKKKEFKTGEYQKKSWWGNRSFKMQEYQGDTDGSRFQTAARQQGATAMENRNALDQLPGDYTTNRYATGTAQEAGVDGVTRMADAETDARRRVYQAPEVMNWREQRPITRAQTKSLLGR